MRRVPTVKCHSMEDAPVWVAAIRPPHLIVIDVEPGVIGWNASPDDRNRELVRVNALLTDAGHVVWLSAMARSLWTFHPMFVSLPMRASHGPRSRGVSRTMPTCRASS